MEPQIQYVKSADGASIAFTVAGEGDKTPLLYLPPGLWAAFQFASNLGNFREFIERLGAQRTVCLMDMRGSGMSSREVDDFSLDALVHDIEAVVDKAGFDTMAVHGNQHTGPAAIAFAGRHPERVSHLILRNTWASRRRSARQARTRAMGALMRTNWEMFAEAGAQMAYGWDEPEYARQMAKHMQESTTQEMAIRFAEAERETDVTAMLPEIKAPTLVILHRLADLFPEEDGRELASSIPNAHLVQVKTVRPDYGSLLGIIEEFIDGERSRHPAEAPEVPSGTAIILFADIVESTALTEQMGDAAFRAKARELDESLRKIIREADGTPVEGKLLWDGVLSVFTSAKNAIDAGLRFGKAAESVGLGLHVGMHAGDVIREGDNVFGGAVNIAARISGESEAGEVLVSDTVRGAGADVGGGYVRGPWGAGAEGGGGAGEGVEGGDVMARFARKVVLRPRRAGKAQDEREGATVGFRAVREMFDGD